MTEWNNCSVYKNGKGARTVPLLVVYQRFLDVFSLLLPYLINTPRGCIEPQLPDEVVEYFLSIGIRCEHGYWSIKCGGTQIGLHAMYWMWINHRHPNEGKGCQGSRVERFFYFISNISIARYFFCFTLCDFILFFSPHILFNLLSLKQGRKLVTCVLTLVAFFME